MRPRYASIAAFVVFLSSPVSGQQPVDADRSLLEHLVARVPTAHYVDATVIVYPGFLPFPPGLREPVEIMMSVPTTVAAAHRNELIRVPERFAGINALSDRRLVCEPDVDQACQQKGAGPIIRSYFGPIEAVGDGRVQVLEYNVFPLWATANIWRYSLQDGRWQRDPRPLTTYHMDDRRPRPDTLSAPVR